MMMARMYLPRKVNFKLVWKEEFLVVCSSLWR